MRQKSENLQNRNNFTGPKLAKPGQAAILAPVAGTGYFLPKARLEAKKSVKTLPQGSPRTPPVTVH